MAWRVEALGRPQENILGVILELVCLAERRLVWGVSFPNFCMSNSPTRGREAEN